MFELVIGLVSVDAALGWRLGIRNTDAVDRHFTWVVADNEADTAQSWVDPGPADYPVTATIALGAEPRGIAVDPDTRRVYVTLGNSGSGTPHRGLVIIDPGTPPRRAQSRPAPIRLVSRSARHHMRTTSPTSTPTRYS